VGEKKKKGRVVTTLRHPQKKKKKKKSSSLKNKEKGKGEPQRMFVLGGAYDVKGGKKKDPMSGAERRKKIEKRTEKTLGSAEKSFLFHKEKG